jgi:hypothetical protein
MYHDVYFILEGVDRPTTEFPEPREDGDIRPTTLETAQYDVSSNSILNGRPSQIAMRYKRCAKLNQSRA